MGTDPQFLTRPRTMAIARGSGTRAAGRAMPPSGGPAPPQRVGPMSSRPRYRQTPPRARVFAHLAVSVGFLVVAEHALERDCGLRDRAAQGKARTRREGGPGAIADEFARPLPPRTRIPVARRAAQTIPLGDGVRSAPSTRRSSASARRSRRRRSTSWRAQGVHVTAQRAVAARQVLVEHTPADRHADAERQSGSFESRAEPFEDIQDLAGAQRRDAGHRQGSSVCSTIAHGPSSGRGRVRVWGRYALSGRSRAIDRGRPQRQWRSHRALASPSAAVCAH